MKLFLLTKIKYFPLLMLLPFLYVDLVVAAAEISAAELVAKVNSLDDGEFVSRKLSMTMTDRRGKVRQRDTQGYRKYFGEEKRSVLFYRQPSNVRGTGFLTYDYKSNEQDDDQWLYLPALRKVRRISASDRGDYFLGTDFSYEDIKNEGKFQPNDYAYKILGVERQQGKNLYRMEGVPRNSDIAKELGYSRVESWVDAETWIVVKAEYWGVRGKHLKTLAVSDIRPVDGIWTRHRMDLKNHKTGHSTQFKFYEVDYKSPVADKLFSKSSLKRGR